MAKVGVVLSGCGVFDGSEIHEAVLTLLALDEAGADYICMAPRGNQLHVINHGTSEVADESRDIFTESARIARGDIRDMADVSASDIDALVFPGGFGAAKNLCDFAIKGVECSVNPEVSRLVLDVHKAGKPLGFACIAPAMAAAIFKASGIEGIKLTVGSADDDAAKAIEQMGSVHAACPVSEARVDEAQKIVTTPAYMLGQRISDVRDGIKAMVEEVLGRIKS